MGQNGSNDTLITQIWPLVPEIFEIWEGSAKIGSFWENPKKFWVHPKTNPIFPEPSQFSNISSNSAQIWVISASIDPF